MAPYQFPEQEEWPHLLFNITAHKIEKEEEEEGEEDAVCKQHLCSRCYFSFPALISPEIISPLIHDSRPSSSITHCVSAPCLQPHTHTHKHKDSDAPRCQRIDSQHWFYRHVWGADTSAFPLSILLSYPNEPCVIHHRSAGSARAPWMAKRDCFKESRVEGGTLTLPLGMYQLEFPDL